MPATARQLDITAADLEGSGGGSYAALEVPGDYEMVLKDVEDYDKRKTGGSWGWIFVYDVLPGDGAEVLEFKVYLSFSKASRWKLVKTLEAHEADMTEGINNVDPNVHIGEVVGGHIDFPRDKEGEPTSKYREVRDVFSLAEAPEVVEPAEEAGVDEEKVPAMEPELEEPAVL